MTTYKDWQTGDVINIAASIDEFCGVESQFIFVKDINVTKSPDACSVSYGTERGCGLHLDNVTLVFKLVKCTSSAEETSCNPEIVYKTIQTTESIKTNTNGVACIAYQVTDQDRLNYESQIGDDSYKVMVCITNSDGQATSSGSLSQVTEPITIIENLCYGLPLCTDMCYGSDLWGMKCDPATGLCVQDALKQANSPICTATHYLDLKLHPHSWYTPQQAADNVIILIADINGAIMNWMTFLTGWTYLGTTIAVDGTTVLIRIYLKEELSVPAPASMHIQSLGIPITAAQIALAFVAIGVITVAIGTIFSAIFGPKDAGQDVGLTNNNITGAGSTFIKGAFAECETITCSDPSLTQDQKATCIKNCYDNLLIKWKEYLEDLYPDANHTPLDNAVTEIQNCYDTYNASAKTPTDYQALTACMQLKAEEGVDKDKDNVLIIYPPDAPAGSKIVPDTGTEDCWIPGLAGGCILTANTGKTIAIIGGLVIGGILVVSLIKK